MKKLTVIRLYPLIYFQYDNTIMTRLFRRIWHSITCRIANTRNAYKMKYFESQLKKNPKDYVEAQVHGHLFRVSPYGSHGKQLKALGRYEPVDTNHLLKCSKSDWICLDIGANIGYYTILLAAQTQHVHAFEPDPIAYDQLAHNVSLNNYSNVTINNIALSSYSGSASFSSAEDSAFSSLQETGRESTEKTLEVQLQTLDKYATTHNLKKIDFIKIDVEGAELLVLEGAKSLLKNQTPQLFMIELVERNLEAYQTSINQVVAYLKEYGYLPHVVDHIDGILRPIKTTEFDKIQNVYFVPK